MEMTLSGDLLVWSFTLIISSFISILLNVRPIKYLPLSEGEQIVLILIFTDGTESIKNY